MIDWASGPWQDREALKAGMLAHNEHIRAITPKENLLEFTPKYGWEPLCAFLGKPVPNEPFPYVNQGSNAANLVKIGIALRLFRLTAMPVAAVVIAWLVFGWSRRS